MDDAWQALRNGLFEDAWMATYPRNGPKRSNPSEGVVGRCLEGPMALPFNDTLRHKGGLIETAWAEDPEGLVDEIFINQPHRRQKSDIFFNQPLQW